MQAHGKSVVVEFNKGPLGLQLADVGKRVLVTAFQDTLAGTSGQAEMSGKISIGNQVVSIAGRSCMNMSMRQILDIIGEADRPVKIEFQPLVIAQYAKKGTESIFSKLGDDGELEVCGETYEVEFSNQFLGLNVCNLQGMVVVSQFMEGGNIDILNRVNLGDRIVQARAKPKSEDCDEWKTINCRKVDFADVAAFVRDAGRPVFLSFEPTKIVRRPVKRKIQKKPSFASSLISKPAKKPRCPKCHTKGPAKSNFCWHCGYNLAGVPFNEQDEKADSSGELLSLEDPSEDLLDLEGGQLEN